MNKINILFVIIIVIIFNSCKQRFNKAVTFQKNYFTFTIDTPFVKSVYSNNKIITLKSDGKFICMNINDFSLDTVTAKKINIKTAYGFYQIFDSLIIVCKDKDYYLTNDFNYIPYNRHKNRFYKSDTSYVYEPWGGPNYIDPLYCDNDYIITQFCLGEFGGTLYFTDRKNCKQYYCPATCACVVNKINNKYIITNSLPHDDGSSEVLEIEDPKTLCEINIDTTCNLFNFWIKKVWDGKSLIRYKILIAKLKGNGKQILDTTGILIYTSFNYNNEIYHIYQVFGNEFKHIPKSNEIYIGKVLNNKIEKLDSLGNLPIFTYDPKTKVYKDYTLYNYNHEGNSGFIAIKDNVINIIKFTIKN